MTKFKRPLSLLLTVLMLVSMVSVGVVTANADDTDDYRAWHCKDSRWKDVKFDTLNEDISTYGQAILAVAKTLIQAGVRNSSEWNVNNLLDEFQAEENKYLNSSNGVVLWANLKGLDSSFNASGGYSNIANKTNAGTTSGYHAVDNKAANYFISEIKTGNHVIIRTSSDSSGKLKDQWLVVDEAMTLATGEIYVMRSLYDEGESAVVALKSITNQFYEAKYITDSDSSKLISNYSTVEYFADENSSVTAEFTYTDNGSTISGEFTSGNHLRIGSTVTVSGAPNLGSTYKEWELTNVSSEAFSEQSSGTLKFTVSDASGQAVKYCASKIDYTISYEGEQVDFSSAKTTANCYDTVDFTVTVADGYVINSAVAKYGETEETVSPLSRNGNTYTYRYSQPASNIKFTFTTQKSTVEKDYRVWSKDNLEWADIAIGSEKLSDGTVIPAIAKIAIQAKLKNPGWNISDCAELLLDKSLVNVSGNSSNGAITDYDKAAKALGFTSGASISISTSREIYDSIVNGNNAGSNRHLFLRVTDSQTGTAEWVAVDEKRTLYEGSRNKIFVMRSTQTGDNNIVSLDSIGTEIGTVVAFSGGQTAGLDYDYDYERWSRDDYRWADYRIGSTGADGTQMKSIGATVIAVTKLMVQAGVVSKSEAGSTFDFNPLKVAKYLKETANSFDEGGNIGWADISDTLTRDRLTLSILMTARPINILKTPPPATTARTRSRK